jgi:H+/Cl- antiporter ClcA
MSYFGAFSSLDGDGSNFNVWELVMFVLIGAAGGVIGAGFNQANKLLSIWRSQWYKGGNSRGSTFQSQKKSKLLPTHWSSRRVIETMVVTLLMSSLSFFLPWAYSDCRPIPHQLNFTDQEKALVEDLVKFQCDEGEYNELASLFFTEGDVAIRHLFHFREMGNGTVRVFRQNSPPDDAVGSLACSLEALACLRPISFLSDGHFLTGSHCKLHPNTEDDLESATFTVDSLLIFFFAYTLMGVITYGIAVPSGLFLPSLLSGAAFGRLVGQYTPYLSASLSLWLIVLAPSSFVSSGPLLRSSCLPDKRAAHRLKSSVKSRFLCVWWFDWQLKVHLLTQSSSFPTHPRPHAIVTISGHMLHRADSFSGTFADAGTYSLIGAVAALGGMARMTMHGARFPTGFYIPLGCPLF